MSGPVTIEVVLPSGSMHLAGWEERHRQGLVPSRWPYGLDGLAWYADEVSVVGVGATRRWHRWGRPITDRLADRRLSRRGGRHIGLTWDEQTAVTMVTRRRHPEMYSGAIWINDRVERGERGVTNLMIAALREMDGVWTLSSAQVEPLRDLLAGADVRVSTFGVDTDFFRQQPWPSAPGVLSLGADRDRDWTTLYDALARVVECRPDVTVRVQAAPGAALPPGVHAIPKVPLHKVPTLYAEASVVAVATRHNLHVSGMTVALEAHASGRPVVATRTPGVDDYYREGVDTVLVDPGDPHAMAEALLQVLNEPARSRLMGEAGRRSVEAHHTTERLVRELAGLMRLERRSEAGRLAYGL